MVRKTGSDNLFGDAAIIGSRLKICVNLCNLQIQTPFLDSTFGVPKFEKILIANRGDQPPTGGAAAQPNCVAAESREAFHRGDSTCLRKY